MPCVPSGRYLYDGMRFDSTAELAFWIWQRDLGVGIERCDGKDRMEFTSGGRIIGYYPDFKLNGKYIEIKGDQFFRPDGTMFCPYRKKAWTDEQYARICQVYADKQECMRKNGVIVLRYKSDEIKAALEYVKEKYGADYLNGFKIKKIRSAV